MGKYQAYPEYKDSGVEWLGKVPASWTILSCRGIVQNKVDKNEGAIEQNYLSLLANVGVVTYEEKGDVGNKKPEDLSKCKIVRRGNLVINSMNYAIGSYGMSDHDGVCSPVYIVLEPITNIIERRLALRIFENKYFQKYLSTFGNGILEHRAAIGWDDIKNAYVAIPPFIEQQAILSFLDHETAKIDALIEKQQQLIQLLKEKRQAVISHAVTKGLNPNAPMKDSGIEWLGEVPAHWDVACLRWFIKIASGDGLPNTNFENEADQDNPYRVIGGNGTMGFTRFLNTDREALAIGRVGALCGNVHLINEPCWVTDNALKISCWLRFDSHYLYFLLQASKLNEYASRSAQPLITGEQVKALKVVIPPIQEQVLIGKHIANELRRFSNLVNESKIAIQLMQERRTALISAAVTGKIDVRNFAEPATR